MHVCVCECACIRVCVCVVALNSVIITVPYIKVCACFVFAVSECVHCMYVCQLHLCMSMCGSVHARLCEYSLICSQ